MNFLQFFPDSIQNRKSVFISWFSINITSLFFWIYFFDSMTYSLIFILKIKMAKHLNTINTDGHFKYEFRVSEEWSLWIHFFHFGGADLLRQFSPVWSPYSEPFLPISQVLELHTDLHYHAQVRNPICCCFLFIKCNPVMSPSFWPRLKRSFLLGLPSTRTTGTNKNTLSKKSAF